MSQSGIGSSLNASGSISKSSDAAEYKAEQKIEIEEGMERGKKEKSYTAERF